jgi:polyhydroxyalkanoate synthesis repressor PhaR
VSVTPPQPPEGRAPSARPRVIKRYANRKLYDTRDSRYVTLLQIAEYVRGGEEVSIIDNTTKEDLTNVTLAQIVYEEERKSGQAEGEARRASPTVSALRTLIQQSGERLMSTLREMAPAGAVGKLIRRDGTEATEADAAAAPPRVAEAAKPAESAKTDESRRILMSPKEAWDELQRLADDRMKAVLGTAITHVHQLQGEVKRLQGRIEELEQKLVAMSAARGTKSDAPTSDRPTSGDS